MAKYKLVDWEDNRYHDSYGKLVYFDSETNSIHITEHWSTAYPGGLDMSEFLMPTAEVIESCKQILADFYFNQMAQSYYSIKYEPTKEEVMKTRKVILNSNFNGRKQGKLAKGTKLEVVRVTVSMFAPHRYSQGALRKDHNAEVRDINGKVYWINLTKLTLDWEFPSEKETMESARNMAEACRVQDMYRCAWLSNNWIAESQNESGYKKAL